MTKTQSAGAAKEPAAAPKPDETSAAAPDRWERFFDWVEELVIPYGRWLKELVDPVTLALIVAAVFLMRVNPKQIDPSVYSFLQVVTALVTGFVGARVSASVLASSQDGKIFASGKAAVRGLQLILRKTVALERRVALFVDQSFRDIPIEEKAAVSQRNLDEVLESVRTLQVEIAGSIDSWGDVVPGADAASIMLSVSGLQDRFAEKESQLREALEIRAALESKGNADKELIRRANSRIDELEAEKNSLQSDIDDLKKSADLPSGSLFTNPLFNTAAASTTLYMLNSAKRKRAAEEEIKRGLQQRKIAALRKARSGSSDSGGATDRHPLPK